VPERRTKALFSTVNWKIHVTGQVITETITEAVLLMRFLRMGVPTEGATGLQRGLDLQRTLWKATSRPRRWQGSNSTAGSGETTVTRQAQFYDMIERSHFRGVQ